MLHCLLIDIVHLLGISARYANAAFNSQVCYAIYLIYTLRRVTLRRVTLRRDLSTLQARLEGASREPE